MSASTALAGLQVTRRPPWALGATGAALLGVGIAAGVALQAGIPPLRAAVLLAVAPLAEELVFRGGLQEALLRRPVAPWLANGATALAFALAHALASGSLQGLAVVVPALLLGHIYGLQRRLPACVLLHASMNGLWLLASL